MNRTKLLCAIALSIGLWAFPLPAADKVGDAAPAIQEQDVEIVSGTWADKSFKEGTVYVVEFWATWCPVSRAAIEHLNKLQREHGSRVVVVGLTSESPEKLRAFLNALEVKPEYVVGVDSTRQTGKNYLAAFGKKNLPTAFIVGKHGKIAWVGGPLEMDAKLREIVKAP